MSLDLKDIQDNIDKYYNNMFDNIQYGLMTKEDMDSLSVMNITLADIQNFQNNKKSIDDKFENIELGINNHLEICPTCNQRSTECPGHFATIELPFYIVNPIFYNEVISVLNSICLSCSRLLLGNKKIINMITKLPKNNRLKELANKSKGQHCTRKHELEDGKILECPKLFTEFSFRKNEIGNIKTIKVKFLPNSKMYCEVNLDILYKIIESIPNEDVQLMGLGDSHPKYLLMNRILIIPPKTRPTVADGNKIYPDGLTKAYKEIINTISSYINTNHSDTKNDKNDILEKLDGDYLILKEIYQSSHEFLLKIPILNSISNLINSSVPIGRTSGKTPSSSSFTKKINGKYGLIRRYMMGKRVNFTARTVVGPSPNNSIEEIGIPKFIAKNLTVKMYVNDINKNIIDEFYKNGKIKSVIKSNGKYKDMKFNIPSKGYNFEIGDIVQRELMDGDYVLANRNPTIHKQGMMGMKVFLVDENIFRLNLALTTPLNADFDGDDLNVFVPQTIPAITELSTFASAEGSYGDGQTSKLMVGLVFDAISGSFLITQDYTFFEENEYHDTIFKLNLDTNILYDKNYNYGKGFVKSKDKIQKCISINLNLLKIYINSKITNEFVNELLEEYLKLEIYINKLNIDFNPYLDKIKFKNIFKNIFNIEYNEENIIHKYIFKYFGDSENYYKDIMNKLFTSKIYSFLKNNNIDIHKNDHEFIKLFVNKISYYCFLKNRTIDSNKIDKKDHYFDKCLEKNVDYLSGKSIFSLLLPNDFYYEKIKSNKNKNEYDNYLFNVKIKNGIIYQGSLNKDNVGTNPNSIPHILFLYKDYKYVTQFLTNAQRLINLWLYKKGFTIGISDCRISENAKKEINKSIASTRVNAIDIQKNKSIEYESQREEKIIQCLQEIRNLNELVINEIEITSPLLVMTELAKSKGKGANLVEIIASIGQQYYKGNRIPNDSSYFEKNEIDPVSRGLILSSFTDGMTPSEFVFHMYSSREGLTDSALKTADVGSEHHNLAKALEILNVKEDRSIRNVSNRIVQFVYGEDSFEPEQLHTVKSTKQQSSFIDIDLIANIFNSEYL